MLIGAGKTFSAGADINEFLKYASGEKPFDDGLHRLIFAAEDSTQAGRGCPAWHGTGRWCRARHRLPLSHRRQPHTTGPTRSQAGIDSWCDGDAASTATVRDCQSRRTVRNRSHVWCAEALEAGIIDRVTDQDLLPAAIDFAREMAARPNPLRKTET